MHGKLFQYLANDHDRLDALLKRAVAVPDTIDMEAYAAFRKGLLRHIGIEERIVMPAIAKFQGGKPAALAARLRLDHGAIAALLVPSPTPAIILTIRSILEKHNPLEEQEGGLYLLLEQVAGEEADRIFGQMVATPEVPVMPHNDGAFALDAAHRAVARAGHEFKTVRE